MANVDNNDLKISVIVPIYKVEEYLHQCIDSIVNQTYRNLEIILVDDGSPDKCGEICDKYAEKDERVVAIHQTNSGPADARNAGIDIAQGSYLIFVDGDDFLFDNNCVQRIAERLKKTTPDVLVYGVCKYIDRSKIYLKSNVIECDELSIEDLVKSDRYGSSSCNKAVRMEAVKQYNLKFPISLRNFEDVRWSSYFIRYGLKIEYLPVCAYVYRQRKGSAVHTITDNKLNTAFHELDIAREDQKTMQDIHTRELLLNYYVHTYIYLLTFCRGYYVSHKNDILKHARLLVYDRSNDWSKRVRYVAVFKRIFGMRLTIWALYFFIKLKQIKHCIPQSTNVKVQ